MKLPSINSPVKQYSPINLGLKHTNKNNDKQSIKQIINEVMRLKGNKVKCSFGISDNKQTQLNVRSD
jgi:hypothetical protein